MLRPRPATRVQKWVSPMTEHRCRPHSFRQYLKTPTFRSVGVFQFAEETYFVAGAAGAGTGGCVSTLASRRKLAASSGGVGLM
jgi:hypothetical protein